MPLFLAALGAGSIFVSLVTYGPRRRGYFDSFLRPRDPFELYDFNGLTDFGKTLAVVIPLVVFVVAFYLLYHYMNKKKLKDTDDLE